MARLLSLLLLAVASPLAVLAQNTYPIVLVHGFGGWGRDELFGLKYWGGLQGDIQEQLEQEGYTVYTASIGSFSSNWDRACELYAQIKGGQVDYGAKHSAAHEHSQLGRNYSALYPEWGEENADGSVNKIHLIGHSMGGQTVRMLTQMLEKGTTGAPVEEDAASHPLFEGGKSWVHSITTISTPNQGTTLADGLSEIGDTMKDLIVTVLSAVGIGGDDASMVYDAQLDQWNISAKADDETLGEYYDRVFSSKIFDPDFTDVCVWSLSVAGAKEESTWVETLENVYYYSYATIDTFNSRDWLLRKISLPNILTMLPALDVTSIFLGSRYAPDDLGLSTDWQPNDGAVNTISMSQDYVGELVTYSGTSEIGKWNEMQQLTGLDHMAITGFTLFTEVFDIYLSHAQLLVSLPVDSSERSISSLFNELVNSTIGSAISSLISAASNVQSAADVEELCSSPADSYAESYCETMTARAKDGNITANATIADMTLTRATTTDESVTAEVTTAPIVESDTATESPVVQTVTPKVGCATRLRR
ncbi:hypothetical protein BBJ28_00023753 [Nothophytophthora sp. Chile5]|nr:hypothetical protein BBJ28_00023753 [Nothophytophthora sp. Chile5]